MANQNIFSENFNASERVLTPLWFEKIDRPGTQAWVQKYQKTVVYCSVAYVIFALVGQHWMKNRKPYNLRRPLILWNWILAIFSILGFLRTAPTFVTLLFQPNGYYRSVCTSDYAFEPETFWALAFTISKLFEFIDTGFIILRKAPLLFLHWYHHMSMAIFSFYLYPISDPIGRWGGILNYGVHSIMYSYYALKIMNRFQISKFVSKIITTLQMGQFILTLAANIYAAVMIATGIKCQLSSTTMNIQLTGSISYLFLFANYFYQTYMKNKPKSA